MSQGREVQEYLDEDLSPLDIALQDLRFLKEFLATQPKPLKQRSPRKKRYVVRPEANMRSFVERKLGPLRPLKEVLKEQAWERRHGRKHKQMTLFGE